MIFSLVLNSWDNNNDDDDNDGDGGAGQEEAREQLLRLWRTVEQLIKEGKVASSSSSSSSLSSL